MTFRFKNQGFCYQTNSQSKSWKPNVVLGLWLVWKDAGGTGNLLLWWSNFPESAHCLRCPPDLLLFQLRPDIRTDQDRAWPPSLWHFDSAERKLWKLGVLALPPRSRSTHTVPDSFTKWIVESMNSASFWRVLKPLRALSFSCLLCKKDSCICTWTEYKKM